MRSVVAGAKKEEEEEEDEEEDEEAVCLSVVSAVLPWADANALRTLWSYRELLTHTIP